MKHTLLVLAAFAAGMATRHFLPLPEPAPEPLELAAKAAALDARLRAHEGRLADLYSAALEVEAACPRAHAVREARSP